MLVVGDTWCAITDPLRYHSRVSGLKSWILIAITWLVSIVFCIASALRRDCRLITSEITSKLKNINWGSIEDEFPDESESPIMLPTSSTNISIRMTGNSFNFNDIYDLCYSCIFFVVIILAPICLVCAMYWKIFSEARQNGLRMRQNGSSPLLQSALNLVTVSAQLTKQAPHERSCSIIGEEESDNADSLNSSHFDVIHIVLRRNSMIADASPTHSVKVHEQNMKLNPKILHASTNKLNTLNRQKRYLEIPKLNEVHSYYQPLYKRNYANDSECVKIMPVNESNKVDKFRTHSVFESSALYCPLKARTCNELRQVHSTPDLQNANSELILLSNGNHVTAKLPLKKGNHSTGSIDKHTDTMTSAKQRSSIYEPPKLSYMTSIRHRLSNASSIFKYREESRAARISILVVIMFLFSYFPYGLLVMLQGRVTFYANSSFLSVLFLLIANISSPFIFAYRNRRVRRGVCRLFGVDAKTNERLQKQRIIMHSNLRTNSCRERKRKTKIVRINRNSAKSSSFSANAHIQCKYTPVPLFNMKSSETEFKRENHAMSETNTDSNDYVSPSCQLATDCQNSAAKSEMHMEEKNGHHINNNLKVKCHVDDIMLNKCNNKINESKQDQSESVRDFANGDSIFIENQNRMCTSLTNYSKISNKNTTHIDGLSKTANLNINQTNSNNCNSGTTTGASVIKQKISLLRCVCMNTVRKHSTPNSPNKASSFFDSHSFNV